MFCLFCKFAFLKANVQKIFDRLENIETIIDRRQFKGGDMDSIRQQKIGKMIQTEMADMLLKDFRHLCGKALVTVTQVRVTPDLSIARVYLSIFAAEDKNSVLNHFPEHVSEIRFTLGKRIRHQVRIIPELQFYIDDSLDFIERIDKALKK
jgi:ribosome-binding factor A